MTNYENLDQLAYESESPSSVNYSGPNTEPKFRFHTWTWAQEILCPARKSVPKIPWTKIFASRINYWWRQWMYDTPMVKLKIFWFEETQFPDILSKLLSSILLN
jgi:hypothetical protein